ncbi:MAG: hypothetical protein FWF01_03155 [Alphaproteobacteria bacterium]|nr:hypothetical protein [Alphaproteobacteria bacterium]
MTNEERRDVDRFERTIEQIPQLSDRVQNAARNLPDDFRNDRLRDNFVVQIAGATIDLFGQDGAVRINGQNFNETPLGQLRSALAMEPRDMREIARLAQESNLFIRNGDGRVNIDASILAQRMLNRDDISLSINGNYNDGQFEFDGSVRGPGARVPVNERGTITGDAALSGRLGENHAWAAQVSADTGRVAGAAEILRRVSPNGWLGVYGQVGWQNTPQGGAGIVYRNERPGGVHIRLGADAGITSVDFSGRGQQDGPGVNIDDINIRPNVGLRGVRASVIIPAGGGVHTSTPTTITADTDSIMQVMENRPTNEELVDRALAADAARSREPQGSDMARSPQDRPMTVDERLEALAAPRRSEWERETAARQGVGNTPSPAPQNSPCSETICISGVAATVEPAAGTQQNPAPAAAVSDEEFEAFKARLLAGRD